MGMVWPFGEERFCNLEGRYLHLVSDNKHRAGTGTAGTSGTDYEASICFLGVYGTVYVRDGEALPSSVSLKQGENLTVVVPNIYSFYPIGNSLNINLRQGSESQPFVTFIEGSSST